MTPKELWDRYAATWSKPESEREEVLKATVANDVTYFDPSSEAKGRVALSSYMGDFQRAVPGGRFEITSVIDHHGRMLAHWILRGSNGDALQAGASFALLSDDGRLLSISGFFPVGAV
jgi:hypothetical protein